jgi:hypothetical protein
MTGEWFGVFYAGMMLTAWIGMLIFGTLMNVYAKSQGVNPRMPFRLYGEIWRTPNHPKRWLLIALCVSMATFLLGIALAPVFFPDTHPPVHR